MLDFVILVCYTYWESESDSDFLFVSFIPLTKNFILTLTASLALLFSSATTNAAVLGETQVVQSSALIEAASADVLSSLNDPLSAEETEDYVRAYFAKTPILAEVARCESQFRQFNKSGGVLRGRVVPDDVGVMQINTYFNGALAKKLGFDIYTLEGNLAFGQWMYDHQGVQPWSASQPCWGK